MYGHLRRRNYAEVEQILSGLQQAYAQGHLTERQLSDAFLVSNDYRADLTPHLTELARRFPESYTACFALGNHHLAAAYTYRTYRRAHDIPERNRAHMHRHTELAWTHLQRATELSAQPTLASAKLLSILTLGGEVEQAWDLYYRALPSSPRSLLLRRTMLYALRAEWGGSLEEMTAFVNRAEHASLAESERQYLHATERHLRAHHLLHFQEQPLEARALFEESLRIQPVAGAHLGLARVAEQQENPAGAGYHYEQALQLEPENFFCQAQLAFHRLRQGQQVRASYRMFMHAVAWGEPWARDVHAHLGWQSWLTLLAIRVFAARK